MVAGANYLMAISLNIDTSNCESIIFTFKGENTIKKVWPTEVNYTSGVFTVPFTQEDTLKLLGPDGTYVRCEAQINFTTKSVSKTGIEGFYVDDTLSTEIIEGNTPSGTEEKVTLEIVGGAVVAKLWGEITEDMVSTAVDTYLTRNSFIVQELTGNEEEKAPSVAAVNAGLDNKLAGCWISFTDTEGNPTTKPYVHWNEEVADTEAGESV